MERTAAGDCPKCGRPLQPAARFCSACGARVTDDESQHSSIPQRLAEALGPDYEIMGELGRGGFAVVYSVRDRDRDRSVAVKVMRPELMSSPIIVERFRREARYVARLDHPNILSASFAVERSDLVYYAMPRVRGTPLSKQLAESGPVPLDGARRILDDVAAGLAHAHAHDVIHRDVKPSNIMIAEDGRAMILDFGIAKALSRDGGTLSISGEALGTPEYMSPEQGRGIKALDPRTDMYSWAVVGYHLLAGRPPYSGDSAQRIVHQHMWAPIPDVRGIRPEVPPSMAEGIARCMAKAPQKRFASMGEAAAAVLG